ncbi:MAG: hypothetical protein RXO76_07120 [Vulcanisaeta sp.]
MSSIIELIRLAKDLLKGDVSIKIDSGEIAFRDARFVLIDTGLVRELWSVYYNYFGPVTVVLFEDLGEAMGRVLRRRIGLERFSNIKDALEYLKDVMRLGGYGVMKYRVKDQAVEIVVENLPIDLSFSDEFRNAIFAFTKTMIASLLNAEVKNLSAGGNNKLIIEAIMK